MQHTVSSVIARVKIGININSALEKRFKEMRKIILKRQECTYYLFFNSFSHSESEVQTKKNIIYREMPITKSVYQSL